MCRSKHVEPSINFGIINSITKLHLVGISTESYCDARVHEYQTHLTGLKYKEEFTDKVIGVSEKPVASTLLDSKPFRNASYQSGIISPEGFRFHQHGCEKLKYSVFIGLNSFYV